MDALIKVQCGKRESWRLEQSGHVIIIIFDKNSDDNFERIMNKISNGF